MSIRAPHRDAPVPPARRLTPLALVLALLGPLQPGWLAAADGPPAAKREANRLAKETSPYLLLHAHNPVDWYPWGPEAFARAKAEDKPIFLSVGYSSCYWCHVMERECFMDEAIARDLNAGFVCIKVDREERPDVDRIYMTALQAFGQGGWPMSMFLTPDGRPFFGGTYFPAKERDGITPFPTVLEGVKAAWRDERPEVEKAADRLAELVKQASADPGGREVALDRRLAAEGVARLAEQFDPEHGGFGYNPRRPDRPKFPEPANLVFLLEHHRRAQEGGEVAEPKAARPLGEDSPATPPLAMVGATLDRMARGGIRDQLAGGYHRYSTVRDWSVPHFEKMLYDNAQLAAAHLLAFEVTGDPRWRREAEATFAFVARSMTGPEGAFHSALDAETEGEEGAYYVWTRDEVRGLLGEDENLFARVYGLDREPNFEGGRYVLLEPRERLAVASELGMTPEALEERLAPLRSRLLAARDRRPAPLLDDKVLTAWNGLMIGAYADGYRVLEDDAYRRAAERAAEFLWDRLREPDGRLLRTYRAGVAKLPAYLEDYAFLADGLLRLHAATGEPKWLDRARELVDRMTADFLDEQDGGFFYTADDHESLLARPKDPFDGVLPGPNAVAIRVLVALADATGEARYLDLAGRTLRAFSATMAATPSGLPMMLAGLEAYLDAREAEPVPVLGEAAPAFQGGGIPAQAATAEAALKTPGPVAPGAEVEAVVTLTVVEGWHAYANMPGSENAIPTVVSLAKDAPATLGAVAYPAGNPLLGLPGEEGPVSVYEGKVKIPLKFTVKPGTAAGTAVIPIRVRYQACNDRSCLPPKTLDVPLKLEVRPR